MMLRGGQSEIRLRLDPSHLGAIELKLSQGGDGTQITMVATDGRVRDALEAGRNQLRDQLAEAGVDLTQFDVKDQSQRHSQSGDERFVGDSDNDLENSSADVDTAPPTRVTVNSDRIVDQRV